MPSPSPPPNHFRILYFASAASFTHRPYDDFRAPVRLTDLFQILDSKYPGMRKSVLASCAVTVNLEYVDVEEEEEGEGIVRGGKGGDEGGGGGGGGGGGEGGGATTIKEGDEVAIIPPVSSG